MNARGSRSCLTLALCIAASLAVFDASARAQSRGKARPPAIGDMAADFELQTVTGESVALSRLAQEGPVVLLVLRGFPGYQCPVCNTQVGQFLSQAKNFADAKANIVAVYPGPAEGLKQHAEDFVRGKTLPENFYLVLDPDYTFTKAYRLRWDAPNETAYPSTFVIDGRQMVQFAMISSSHGGRSSAQKVLDAVKQLKAR